MTVFTKKDDTCPVSGQVGWQLWLYSIRQVLEVFLTEQNISARSSSMDWGALCGHAMRKQVCRGLEGNGPTVLQGHGNCSLHYASSPYIWKKSLTSVCLVKYSQRCSSQNRASKFQICRVPKSKEIDHLKVQYVVWIISLKS